MPKNPPSGWNAYPKLGDAARAGMLIVCHCRKCRRTVHYYATDLMEHFTWVDESRPRRPGAGPQLTVFRIIGQLWGKCPRCDASGGDWSERQRYPNHEDVWHTLIRRPIGFRQIRQWRDEWYEQGATVQPPVA